MLLHVVCMRPSTHAKTHTAGHRIHATICAHADTPCTLVCTASACKLQAAISEELATLRSATEASSHELPSLQEGVLRASAELQAALRAAAEAHCELLLDQAKSLGAVAKRVALQRRRAAKQQLLQEVCVSKT